MYEAKSYTHLLGVQGFSDTLLTNHFTLYQGYVNNVNILLEKMNTLREERFAGDDSKKEESAELHRRYGWEYNGMKLHELYFDNIAKGPSSFDPESVFGKRVISSFGSFDAFAHNFTKHVGMFRGIGWVALVQRDDTLGVIWVGEHDEGLLANSTILLIMDVFEHAFMVDYGLKRADYITAFWNAVDWEVVNKRFEATLH